VISTSDIVILVAASSALAVGVYRWHSNTQDVSAITIPANNRVVVESVNTPNAAALDSTPLTDSVPLATVVKTETVTPASNEPVLIQTTPVENVVVTSTEPVPDSVSLGSHQVRAGDYLGKIADQYGTDVQTLRDLNNINGSIIQIGQEIFYPL